MKDESPYNTPIGHRNRRRSARWFMVAISVFFHVIIIVGFVVFAKNDISDISAEDFKISITDAPFFDRNLPTLENTEITDAGAPSQMEEVKAPEEQVVEEKAEEPPKEEPVKETPKPEKVETKPKPDTTIVSPKSTPDKTEPEPEKEPELSKVEKIAKQLEETSKASGEKTKDVNYGNTTVSGDLKSYSDPGGQGAPVFFHSLLVAKISEKWNPRVYRSDEDLVVIVRFTLYSPELPANATNQKRTAEVTNIQVVESNASIDLQAKAKEAVQNVDSWPPFYDSMHFDTMEVICVFRIPALR